MAARNHITLLIIVVGPPRLKLIDHIVLINWTYLAPEFPDGSFWFWTIVLVHLVYL